MLIQGPRGNRPGGNAPTSANEVATDPAWSARQATAFAAADREAVGELAKRFRLDASVIQLTASPEAPLPSGLFGGGGAGTDAVGTALSDLAADRDALESALSTLLAEPTGGDPAAFATRRAMADTLGQVLGLLAAGPRSSDAGPAGAGRLTLR